MATVFRVGTAMPSRLARSLQLDIRGQAINVQTPLLIPSFSTKALIDIRKVFEALQPSITESLLISAYDISFSSIEAPSNDFAEVLFLDSGGYEIAKDYDIMKPLYPSPDAKSWSIEEYRKVLGMIDPVMPTIITSFDHPDERRKVPEQIAFAIETFKEFPELGRELLIKPETKGQTLVSIPSVTAQVQRFSEFDVIGITEDELGTSILERMANIARVRIAMDAECIVKPFHVYGSLDPVCTPLYFLAGADIFDGLSWLRFSYWNDMAVYHRNRAPLQFGIKEHERRALVRSYGENLFYLSDLTRRMHRYLLDKDEDRLGTHSEFFKESLDELRVRLKGVI